MSEYVKVALDAMGGDNAPAEVVKGALMALDMESAVRVNLFGKRDAIEACLQGKSYPKDRLVITDASEVIETTDHPVESVRKKKDSSIVLAMKAVHDGAEDAFVSAGSSGAILVGGQTIIGRLKGVERPPFASIIPTVDKPCLLMDAGANVDAKASWLVQFAKIGSIYMEHAMNVRNPRVGIVNIGAEEEKGNSLVKETFPLLKECEGINFVGSVEARDIIQGMADVVVCDAFVGNVILKMYEGVGTTLIKIVKDAMMSTTMSKIGALLAKPALKTALKDFTMDKYGGAPLLGLKGLVMKTHGTSRAIEVANTICQCVTFKRQNINDKIVDSLSSREDKA